MAPVADALPTGSGRSPAPPSGPARHHLRDEQRGARVTTTASGPPVQAPARRRTRRRTTDRGFNRAFRWIAVGSGVLMLAVLAAVALFLLVQAWPALTASEDDLAASVPRYPADTSLLAYVGPLVFGTLLAAALALALATPV